MKIRKKGKLCIKYNTKDTYTVSIWSAYVDFIEWKVLNLPAIRLFSLSSVIGNQPSALRGTLQIHLFLSIVNVMWINWCQLSLATGRSQGLVAPKDLDANIRVGS